MLRGVGGDGTGRTIQRRETGRDGESSEASGAPVPFVPVCEERVEPPEGASTPSRGEVGKTLALIDQLRAAMTLHRELVADNYLENIRRYLTAAGGDGGIAMSRASFSGLGEKAVTRRSCRSRPSCRWTWA